MAIAAIIDSVIFCVHGGLSPSIETVEDIDDIDRICEIPHEGPLTDLMWSDPSDCKGFVVSPRGAGYLFGHSIVNRFL